MRIISHLHRIATQKRYNPDEDQSIRERRDIAEHTERIFRTVERIHMRAETQTFPILIDRPGRNKW